MRLKYFYYISETKVNMLYSQVESQRFKLPSVLEPKVEYAGFSLGVNIQRETDRELVEKTVQLTKALEKEKLLQELKGSGSLDTTSYYYSFGSWHSGLFLFEAFRGPVAVTYVVWRELPKSIILLVGSPRHILGGDVVKEGVFIPGTSGAIDMIGDFFSKQLSLGNEEIGVQFVDLDSSQQFENMPMYVANNMTFQFNDEDRVERELSLFTRAGRFLISSDFDGIAVGSFCLKHFRRLPISQLETIFRIYRVIQIPSDEKTRKECERLEINSELFNYKQVYLGSPIYTAIA